MGAGVEGLLPSQKTVKMISTHLLINMFRHKYSPGHDILQISRTFKYYKLVVAAKFQISKFQNQNSTFLFGLHSVGCFLVI